MLQVFRNAFALPDLRKRLLFTIGILVLYQLAAHVPVPGVNQAGVAKPVGRAGRRQRFGECAQPVVGRRAVELLGVGDGRVSVHHRPDYYPVAGGRDSVAGTHAARGRHGGSQEVGDLHVHSRHPDGAVVGHWPDPHLQQRRPGDHPRVWHGISANGGGARDDDGWYVLCHLARPVDHRGRHRTGYLDHHLRRHRGAYSAERGATAG